MKLTRAEVLQSIDTDAFLAIRKQHRIVERGPNPQKYLDLQRWIDVNLRRAGNAGLMGQGRPRRVLDLGCGCGYFVHIARLLGHTALGVDRKDHPDSVFTQMRKLLKVPCITHDITPDSPPPVEGRWDVVTAHMVCFNGHRTDRVWDAADWAKLFAAIDAPLWVMELNAEPDGTIFTPDLRGFFEAEGGTISGSHVVIHRRAR